MKTPAVALPIPERVTLSEQTAAIIRREIHEGTWSENLPSERTLTGLFRVSRPTVRNALRMLADERLIEIRHGHSVRILSRRVRSSPPRSRLVVIVTPEPVSALSMSFYSPITEMRTYLAEHGFMTEVFVCGGRSAGSQQRKLDAFLTQNRAFCCVLLSVRRELHACVSNMAIPALVVGSCHPSINLPSVDIDYRAVCRHAADLLLRRGHRDFALVVPDSEVAGDLESEQGFRDGLANSPIGAEASGSVIRHSGATRDIISKLDAVLDRAAPPTALLVAKPDHAILVIMHLLRRGRSVPDFVSVMARDHDNLFARMIPAVTHYYLEKGEWKRHVTRLILEMVRHGRLPAKPSPIFPVFFQGATVSSPRPQ